MCKCSLRPQTVASGLLNKDGTENTIVYSHPDKERVYMAINIPTCYPSLANGWRFNFQ